MLDYPPTCLSNKIHAVQRKRDTAKEEASRKFVGWIAIGVWAWGFGDVVCCLSQLFFFWFRLDFSSDHHGFRNKQTLVIFFVQHIETKEKIPLEYFLKDQERNTLRDALQCTV